MGQVIQIDEARIRDHLGEMVRGTVEEALNAMLDAEADRLYGAGRYERTEGRQDTRAGHYERNLETKAGKVSDFGYRNSSWSFTGSVAEINP
ncbi:MAG: transposase [Bauldia litoralis]